jgi:hypothetical protein
MPCLEGVKARADRVKRERNDAYVAERNKPPPF